MKTLQNHIQESLSKKDFPTEIKVLKNIWMNHDKDWVDEKPDHIHGSITASSILRFNSFYKDAVVYYNEDDKRKFPIEFEKSTELFKLIETGLIQIL